MADFTEKLALLSERGTPVGAEEMIERVERHLAGQPLVVVSGQREGYDMTKTRERTTTPVAAPRTRFRWAIAAFVIVLGIGGGLFALSRDDGAPPAGPETTTTTTVDVSSPAAVIDEFWRRHSAGDVAGFYAFLHPDATWSSLDSGRQPVPYNDDGLVQGVLQSGAYHIAATGADADRQCQAVANEVTCDVVIRSAFRAGAELDRYTVTFVVEDGLIVTGDWTGGTVLPGADGIAVIAFRDWVEECYPDEVDVLFRGRTYSIAQSALPRLRELADEFVAADGWNTWLETNG